MPLQAPNFGSLDYWNSRFTSNSDAFEWLEAPTALDPYLVSALRNTSDPSPEILHIGCGTSLLSFHLRAHVENPESVHNLDYSMVAIDVGREKEVEIFGGNGDLQTHDTEVKLANAIPKRMAQVQTSRDTQQVADAGPRKIPSESRYMRWSTADLLNHMDLLRVCRRSNYSVIVEKSTSDSIACADDIHVPLPYPVSVRGIPRTKSRCSKSSEPIHTLHVLAIHMALLTKPNARWISLSYSADRYPFLHRSHRAPGPVGVNVNAKGGEKRPEWESVSTDSLDEDLDDLSQAIIDSGLPDPGTLWTLESKYEIEAKQETPKGAGTTHRPKIMHWVYVLKRTDVEVYVRDEDLNE